MKGPLEVTTYRIEQWTRDGQILRALYVDDNGIPLTLRTALAEVDQLRHPSNKNELRIVNNRTAQPIDEEAERRPWWQRPHGNEAASTGEAAGMLVELAEALRADGDQPMPQLALTVSLQAEYYGADKDDVRRGHAELLAKLLGQKLEHPHGRTYETTGCGAYVLTYAEPPVDSEPVDEPSPELVDVDRENPETGEPVPDGIEGHPVGRDVEQTARAILQPDTLPNPAGVEPVDQEPEKRCHCGTPWALIISGHTSHADDCAGEAGETEDALNVPGLTAGEADDFMSGGAR